MPHADFVHLRVHSAYSLSEGAIKVKQLVDLCKRHRMPAVAVTDSGNLFGAFQFAQAAAEAGIQPIIGCQLGIRRESSEGSLRPGVRPAPDQLILLVQNETGYRNLLRLVSKSFLEGEPGIAPQLPLATLAGMSDGLIAFTGGANGGVGRLLAEGQDEAAALYLGELQALFPGRLYIELMRHGLPVERAIEGRLLDLAYARNLPLIATNEVFFADAGMYEAHDALLCIAQGAVLGEQQRRRVTPEHRFKTAGEMRALFADLPEAIDNTLLVARRCAYMPAVSKPILPPFASESGAGEPEELRRRAEAGLALHMAGRGAADEKTYRARLDYEIGVIVQMGFAGYFLIVADFIGWAKQQGIPVGPGRGSGAGSVVAWSLGITDLDPLRWGLLFERFLNPERVSMPDFDIDFCQERRDEVIRYVQGKYGRDRVAQIITFGKLQARAALRDVGRVLQMPYGQVDRLCKLVPNNPANPVSLAQAIEGEAQLRAAIAEDGNVSRLFDIARKLEGLYRHASTHAAGVVIGDRPLEQLVPMYRDPRSDMPVTQFSMKDVEQAGLVKFDFLGLKTLTVLTQAEKLLRARGVDVDLARLPLDDPKSYEMLSRGDSTGVFQLESSGMRDALRKLKPDRFEDIIAIVALYRPGPMDNIPSYISRKHGAEKPDYLHPSLEGILKETFGIMIYQEQVMQIAQTLSGYSLGSADLLRRAMGKKIKEEMEAQREDFVAGAVANKVDKGTAAQIFDQVNKFAGYGFNKSHAAAYALIAYQTAWLKANHPVEFYAASMTLDIHNTDKLGLFRQEMERAKIKLLPPDINLSQPWFSVEQMGSGEGGEAVLAVRYALSAVRNVGLGAAEAIAAEREKAKGEQGGRFKSLADFAHRCDPRALNKRALENLIAAGSFDTLNPNRRQTFESAELLLRQAGAAANDRESRQVSLFGGELAQPERLSLPIVSDWPGMEKLRHEFDAIGFYLSAHPLDSYGATLKRLDVIRFADLASSMTGRPSVRAKLAGIVTGKQERTSARGSRFAFVQMSDASGMYEVTLFSELLAAHRELLEPGTPLLVSVDVRLEPDNIRLTAQQIQPLDQAAAQTSVGLKVYLSDAATLPSLRQIMDRCGRGRGRLHLVLELDRGRECELTVAGGWTISPATRGAIKAISGVVDVQEV
jgi:DNA polymerase-3 subunit alpha